MGRLRRPAAAERSPARRVYSTGPEGRIEDTPRTCSRCGSSPCECPVTPAGASVVVRRQRRGRQGKTVTSAGPLPLTRAEATTLVAELRRRCGSGGTLRRETFAGGGAELHLEIQGDHADRLQRELVARGFTVKRSGG